MAARCSRFGWAFRQNQTGSSSSASKADDCVTLATTGLHLPSSEKSSKYLTIFPAATARAIISSPLTIAYHLLVSWQRHRLCLAPKGRKNVAPGASPGFLDLIPISPGRGGRSDDVLARILSPLARADWFGDAISPGSRPGLIIYRAYGASNSNRSGPSQFREALQRNVCHRILPQNVGIASTLEKLVVFNC